MKWMFSLGFVCASWYLVEFSKFPNKHHALLTSIVLFFVVIFVGMYTKHIVLSAFTNCMMWHWFWFGKSLLFLLLYFSLRVFFVTHRRTLFILAHVLLQWERRSRSDKERLHRICKVTFSPKFTVESHMDIVVPSNSYLVDVVVFIQRYTFSSFWGGFRYYF